MMKPPIKTLQVPTEKRILNEFGAKILNEERLETVVKSRRTNRLSTHSEIQFRCECDSEECMDTITMSTQEYEKVHDKTKHFIVVPGHVRLDLENIVCSFYSYVLVAKFFPRTGGRA